MSLCRKVFPAFICCVVSLLFGVLSLFAEPEPEDPKWSFGKPGPAKESFLYLFTNLNRPVNLKPSGQVMTGVDSYSVLLDALVTNETARTIGLESEILHITTNDVAVFFSDSQLDNYITAARPVSTGKTAMDYVRNNLRQIEETTAPKLIDVSSADIRVYKAIEAESIVRRKHFTAVITGRLLGEPRKDRKFHAEFRNSAGRPLSCLMGDARTFPGVPNGGIEKTGFEFFRGAEEGCYLMTVSFSLPFRQFYAGQPEGSVVETELSERGYELNLFYGEKKVAVFEVSPYDLSFDPSEGSFFTQDIVVPNDDCANGEEK